MAVPVRTFAPELPVKSTSEVVKNFPQASASVFAVWAYQSGVPTGAATPGMFRNAELVKFRPPLTSRSRRFVTVDVHLPMTR